MKPTALARAVGFGRVFLVLVMPNATLPSFHDSSSARQRPRATSPFLCASYFAGEGERYEPSQTIDRCPLAGAGELCKIRKHGFRERKTGPQIPLRILLCMPHCRHFTVYPPGHVPYGRSSVAVVDLRGETIERSEAEPEASCRDCLFEAALDAATGRMWEREPVEDLERPRYPTQQRRLERCGQLLGLSSALPRMVVEEIRDHLGLDGLDHSLERHRFQQAQGPTPRAEAILATHQQIGRTKRVQRLLAAGSLSGLWGHPWLWDASRGQRFSLLGKTLRSLRAPP